MEQEHELVARCRRGDPEAWDELFDRHYPAAARFIHQLSPSFSPEDTEEICQEVFLAVVRNLQNFQGHSSFQTWLFRIAANKARDFVEKARAAKRGGGEVPYSLNSAETGSGAKLDPASSDPAPDSALMSFERMMLVRESLEHLGDPCREIIELRYFGDLSYEEIAAELQMNTKTVSSRLSKCLDKLEEILRFRMKAEETNPNPV